MKIADASTRLISNDGTVFDSPSDFPEGQKYVKRFPKINKLQKLRKVFVSCKIESSLRLSQFKFGERTIMAALIKHNTFVNYDKYRIHKEDNIRWFKYISPTVALQKSTRIRLEETLMTVYMTEEKTKVLTKPDEKESDKAVVIPVFDIHSKNIGNGNGTGRITTNAYEFHYYPDNSNIFKALLARCFDDINNDYHFIPFGLPQLTTIATYRNQIKLQNNYLASMTITPIHGVTKSAMEDKVEEKLLKLEGISRLEKPIY